MSGSLDRLVSELAPLDPRLRVERDLPDCFLCGKTVLPAVCVTVEGDAFHGLKAHMDCANTVLSADPIPPTELYRRARIAMNALYPGRAEAPVAGTDVVRGRFS